MAVARLTAFADTTEQTVTAARAYLKGIAVSNFAGTAVDGWVSLYNVANPTPGTTDPDIVLYVPWSTVAGKRYFRVSYPRIGFGTAITAFYSDTGSVDVSAWNGSAATGYAVEVYYEPY